MTYQNGVMPTNEWFKKIKKHVDFKGKTVFDYGCAEGVLSLLALKEGAEIVNAVDNQAEMVIQASETTEDFFNSHVFLADLENFAALPSDIVIMSMIIHWIGKKETRRFAVEAKQVVIVFREKHDGYKEPENGIWFPTQEELDATLKGFSRTHQEVLLEQDNNKRIILAIYEQNI